MSAGDRILDGLREAIHHEENCPKRAGSYACECGVVVHAPYRPVAVHYEEGDYLEYVERDVPTVAEAISHGFAILRDMKTREIVGFRLADWAYLSEEISRETA